MAQFTRENFDYQGYSSQQGLSQEDFDELSQEGRDGLYNSAVTQYAELVFGEQKGNEQSKFRSTIGAVVDTFDDSQQILGLPEPVQDVNEFINRDKFVEFTDQLPEHIKRKLTLDQAANIYADEFTGTDEGYLRFPQFRATKSISEKRSRSAVKDLIIDSFPQDAILSSSDLYSDFVTRSSVEDVATTEGVTSDTSDRGRISNLARATAGSFVSSFVEAGAGVSGLFGADDTAVKLRGISDSITEFFDADADSGFTVTGNVIGNIASFIVPGGALKLVGAAGKLGKLSTVAKSNITAGTISTAQSVGYSASDFRRDYETTLAAKGETVDEETADAVELFGVIPGLFEVAAPLLFLGRLGGAAMSSIFKTVAIEAGTEGATEVLTSLSRNLVAADIIGYDSERDIFVTSQAAEEFAIGATAGGVMSLLVETFNRRNIRISPSNTTASTQEDQSTDPLNKKDDVVVRPSEKGSAAIRNGKVFIGDDAEGAILNASNSFASLGDSIQLDPTDTEIQQDADTASILDDDGKVLVKFKGDNSTDVLQRLVERSNDPNDGFGLVEGINITDTEDGYIIKLGNTTVKTKELTSGIRKAVDAQRNLKPSPRIKLFQVEKEDVVISIPVRQPKGRKVQNLSGFREPAFGKTKDIEASLSDQGFDGIVIKGKTITAQRDGLNYKIDIGVTSVDSSGKRKKAKGKTKARTANIIVTDKDGRLVQRADTQNQPITDVDGQLVSDSISLNVPRIGFKVDRVATPTGDIVRFDRGNFEQVAKRSGGVIEYFEPTIAEVKYGDESVTIYVDEDNNVSALLENGEQIRVTSDVFDINNVEDIGIVTDRLIDAGYTVTKQSDNETILKSISDETVIIKEDDNGVVTVTDDQGDPVSSTPDQFIDDTNDQQDIAKSVSSLSVNEELDIATQTETAVILDDVKKFNASIDDKFSRIKEVDGQFVLDNENGSRVIFETETKNPEEVRDLLISMELSKYDSSVSQIVDPADRDWTVDEMMTLIRNIFPAKIANTIRIHDTRRPDIFPEVNGKVMAGFFAPSSDESGNYIHINGAVIKSKAQILDVIAEEVGHFGWDAFAIPEVTALYDDLFDVVRSEILKSDSLKLYLRPTDDINNLKPNVKYMIVNEYFSKLGVSILNFDSLQGVDRPLGMTKEIFEGLKSAAITDGITEITISTLERNKDDNSIVSQDDAKKLVENIIQLQTLASRGRGFTVNYTNDTDSNIVTVRSTPYGRATRRLDGADKDAIRIARRKDLHRGTGKYQTFGKTRLNMLRFIDSHSIFDTPIGRENTMRLSARHSNESKIISEGLRNAKETNGRLSKILRDNGMSRLKLGESYHAKFVQAGIKDANHLKLASEIDQVVTDSLETKYQRVSDIHDAYNNMLSVVNRWEVDNAGQPRALEGIKAFKQSMIANQLRINADWQHGRYDAYTRQGHSTLVDMMEFLRRGNVSTKSLQSKANEAADIRNKLLSKNTLTITENRALAEANATITKFRRLNSLHKWAVSKVGDNQEAVNNEMASQLQTVINSNQYSGGEGTGKMNDISSNRGTTLDIEGSDLDRLYADFLGRITDPVDSIIHDLEQQQLILNALKSTNELADNIVKHGIGRVKGSVLGDVEISSQNSTVLSEGQTGTLLELVEIDELFAVPIREEINLAKQYSNSWLNAVIGQVKRNLVVRSGFGITSSYIGNLWLPVMSGHIFTKKAWQLPSRSQEVKELYRMRFDTSITPRQYASARIREMVENNLVGTGVTAATVEINETGLLNDISKFVEQNVESDAIKDATQKTADVLTNLDDKLGRIFSFSDDFPKALPYIINHDLGLMEARLKIKRDEFGDSTHGQNLYDKAVNDAAVKFAVERTRRETVTWELIPQFARRYLQGNIRIITPDFVGHMIEMTRLIGSSHLMIVDDYRKAKEHRAAGNTELANAYASHSIKRALGTGLNDAMMFGSASGGAFLMSEMIKNISDFVVGEPDEDEDFNESNTYTPNQWEAANQLMRVWSDLRGDDQLSPTPYHNGKVLTAVLYNRSNVGQSLVGTAPVNEFDTDHAPLEQFFRKFFNLSDGNLLFQIVGLLSDGQDSRTGTRIKTHEDRLNTAVSMVTPRMATELYEVLVGKRMMTSKEVSAAHVAATAISGHRFLETTPQQILQQYAFSLKRFRSSYTDVESKSFMQQLLSGDTLNESAIDSIVSKSKQRFDDKFNEAAKIVGSAQQLGLNEVDIIKAMSKKLDGSGPTGFAKDDAASIVKGINPFIAKINKSLVGELKKQKSILAKQLSSDPTFRGPNAEKVQNKITNLKIAIGKYN